MTKYFTCAETAKIVRKALKESFPDMKFSVVSKTYSGGASMSIGWTDGPNRAQVQAVAAHFEAAYVDGGIDYKGSIYHMMDGEQVHFGADFIHFNRNSSEVAMQRAIDRVYRKYAGNFSESAEPKATVAEFTRGTYWSMHIPGVHWGRDSSIQSLINEELSKHSDRLKVQESPTAKRAFVTHDDNYSNTSGSGFSVMPTDL